MPSWFKGSKKYNKTGDHAIGENFSFVSDVENGEHQGGATMMETYSHGPAPVTILFGEQNEDFDDVDHDSIDHVDIENHYVAGEGGGRGRGQGGRGGGRDDDGDDFKDEDDAANITQDTIDIGEGEEISFDKSISMRGKSITDLQPIDLDDFCCGLPSSSNNIGSLALASMMTTMMTTSEAAEAGGCVDALEGGGGAEEEEHDQQQQEQREGGGGSGKIRSIQLCSTEDGGVDDDCEETNSAASSPSAVAALDNIRGIGPIRDRGGGGGQDGGGGIDQSSSAASPMCMKMNNLPYSGEKNRSKLYWYITVTFICLLLAAIIGTVVAVYGNPKSNNEEQQKTSTNDDVNSITVGSMGDKENGIKAVLAMSVPPPTDFNTAEGLSSSSPQAMAFDWIVNTDEAQLTVDTASVVEITERFAAATLYFATGGPSSWITSLGFLSADSICNWNDGKDVGIFCYGEGETAGSPTEIKIVANNLSGSIPNEINYFTDLETLDLYYNKLLGAIPDLSQLIKLRQFDVDGNMLSGMAPESLFNLPSIVNMYLLNNKDLTGTIPVIGDTSRLEKISILGCSFTGSIPQSLTAVSTLRLLQMKDNAISGTIPAGLLSLPALETLGLHGNRLVGSIPSIDATATGTNGSALRSLSLGSNSLEGSLPDGIDTLIALQFLYAHDNALTGVIRNEIVALPLLEQLWLYENNLTGEIPEFTSSSSTLTDLFLSDNDLSGNLQDLLASAPTSIERIDVSNNNIRGFISDDINQLTKVQTFAVAGNKLTGVIPEDIVNLVSLTSFDFSSNPFLEGDLTSTLCTTPAIANKLIFAAADCNGGDPVRVNCDCCTECCDRSGECTPNNSD